MMSMNSRVFSLKACPNRSTIVCQHIGDRKDRYSTWPVTPYNFVNQITTRLVQSRCILLKGRNGYPTLKHWTQRRKGNNHFSNSSSSMKSSSQNALPTRSRSPPPVMQTWHQEQRSSQSFPPHLSVTLIANAPFRYFRLSSSHQMTQCPDILALLHGTLINMHEAFLPLLQYAQLEPL